MLDAERLLDLLETTATVKESPDASNLVIQDGHIKFENVSFSYDSRKEALNHISFEVLPGTTTALVGETGGGKSTCLRLLFRFYDPIDGRITIDGQDIKYVTTESLRDNLGVVPQV